MTIIPATAAHVGIFAPVFARYLAFYGRNPDNHSVEAFLRERLERGESLVYLALTDPAEVLGFVQLYPCWSSLSLKRLWILNDLFVVPGARRGGVGRRLIERSVQLARETGAKGLVLETAKNNFPARSLYESLGWILEEEFDRYAFDLS